YHHHPKEEEEYFRRKLAIARKRAKSKNLAFDLDIKWCRNHKRTTCEYFGSKLIYVSGAGLAVPEINIPSIDRIDSTKDYLQENCRFISQLANRLRSDASWEQLMAIASKMKQEQNCLQADVSATDCEDIAKTPILYCFFF
ncbi:MAG: hypothetical protein ACRC80_08730, partial [Waterburya sp.]